MSPINIKVKSIWQGQVGIRDKYCMRALKECRDLNIVVGSDQMIIDHRNLLSLFKGRSDKSFKDKFGGNAHYLVYFDWKPKENKQQELI